MCGLLLSKHHHPASHWLPSLLSSILKRCFSGFSPPIPYSGFVFGSTEFFCKLTNTEPKFFQNSTVSHGTIIEKTRSNKCSSSGNHQAMVFTFRAQFPDHRIEAFIWILSVPLPNIFSIAGYQLKL